MGLGLCGSWGKKKKRKKWGEEMGCRLGMGGEKEWKGKEMGVDPPLKKNGKKKKNWKEKKKINEKREKEGREGMRVVDRCSLGGGKKIKKNREEEMRKRNKKRKKNSKKNEEMRLGWGRGGGIGNEGR